ncbi:glycoside hydrolase superfamily [Mrakia frigida]|uniref:glycoside hydrolase superfamily n=1 Tax=Mrakia frigida TaxID=29902 RepID=UPI003FCC059C
MGLLNLFSSSASSTAGRPSTASLLVLGLALATQAQALTSSEWMSRSVYQVVTDRFALTNGSTPSCESWIKNFCGGSWLGIIDKLDYVQGMGFDAVWISPVEKNVDSTDPNTGQAFHQYWPSNLFELNQPGEDLLALSNALHARGMALMVDIVINHVGWVVPSDTAVFDPTIGESSSGAGDGVYGPLDSTADFHAPCGIDYSNETSIENCWLGFGFSLDLVDINTQSDTVRSLIYAWIGELVSTYSIDGLRLDAARHVEGDFWKGFQDAAGVFTIGEVFDSDPQYVKTFQTLPGLNSVLNYPVWYPAIAALTSTSGSMKDFSDMIQTVRYHFSDSRLLGSFVGNHDVVRARSITTDSSLLSNLFAYPFAIDGIPIWYYGDEQDGSDGGSDPLNREALWTLSSTPYDTSSTTYKQVHLYNQIRKAAAAFSTTFYSHQADIVQYDDNDIVITKAPLISVLNNRGSGQSSDVSITFLTSYEPGTVVVDAISCTQSTVDENAKLTITVKSGLPQMFLPLAAVTSSSGVCQ